MTSKLLSFLTANSATVLLFAACCTELLLAKNKAQASGVVDLLSVLDSRPLGNSKCIGDDLNQNRQKTVATAAECEAFCRGFAFPYFNLYDVRTPAVSWCGCKIACTNPVWDPTHQIYQINYNGNDTLCLKPMSTCTLNLGSASCCAVGQWPGGCRNGICMALPAGAACGGAADCWSGSCNASSGTCDPGSKGTFCVTPENGATECGSSSCLITETGLGYWQCA